MGIQWEVAGNVLPVTLILWQLGENDGIMSVYMFHFEKELVGIYSVQLAQASGSTCPPPCFAQKLYSKLCLVNFSGE